jgi:hypothetical protein
MVPAFLPAIVMAMSLLFAGAAPAQTPAPFPRPGGSERTPPQPPTAKPAPPPAPAPATAAAPKSDGAPDEQLLGVPIYPGAQFIASYDAGHNQRYYLFGTNTSFTEIVTYYRTSLKQRGELVYDEPPVHEFDVGRYREETMAFPPGVTVKDYTSGGAKGYLNPKRGAQPARFKTIIMIVPVVP